MIDIIIQKGGFGAINLIFSQTRQMYIFTVALMAGLFNIDYGDKTVGSVLLTSDEFVTG